jgi:hypothetical protein
MKPVGFANPAVAPNPPQYLINAHGVANTCCANIGGVANRHRWELMPHEAIFAG